MISTFVKMKFTALIALLLFTSCTFAQRDTTVIKPGFSVNSHLGFLLSHHTTMQRLVKGHVRGVELSYVHQATGNFLWEKDYNFPETGASLLLFDLSNPKELGLLMVGSAYVDFRLFKIKNTWFAFRLSTGLSYLTKSFHRTENFKNNAIGSHLNSFIGLRVKAGIPLSKTTRLDLSTALTHASNGAFKMPNLGINIPTISLGFSYFPSGVNHDIYKADREFDRAWKISALAAFGVSENEPAGGKPFPAFLFSGLMNKRITAKSRVGYGIDIFYNAANIPKIESLDSTFNDNWKNIQPAIKGSYELMMGEVAIPMEMGVYTYTKAKNNGHIYTRVGIRYYAQKLVYNVTLKTHFAKADFLEFGIGYKIK